MLLHFTRQIHDWVRRFGQTTFAHPGRPVEAIGEHERILDAIDVGNAELAERLAREHMGKARQIRLAMIREDGMEG